MRPQCSVATSFDAPEALTCLVALPEKGQVWGVQAATVCARSAVKGELTHRVRLGTTGEKANDVIVGLTRVPGDKVWAVTSGGHISVLATDTMRVEHVGTCPHSEPFVGVIGSLFCPFVVLVSRRCLVVHSVDTMAAHRTLYVATDDAVCACDIDDNGTLYVACSTARLYVFDVTSGAVICEGRLRGDGAVPRCVVLLGAHVWVGRTDGVISILDRDSLDTVEELTGHRTDVTSVHPMTCGDTVWSASSDGNLLVWSAETFELNGVFEQHDVGLHAAVPVCMAVRTHVWCVDDVGHTKVWNVYESVPAAYDRMQRRGHITRKDAELARLRETVVELQRTVGQQLVMLSHAHSEREDATYTHINHGLESSDCGEQNLQRYLVEAAAAVGLLDTTVGSAVDAKSVVDRFVESVRQTAFLDVQNAELRRDLVLQEEAALDKLTAAEAHAVTLDDALREARAALSSAEEETAALHGEVRRLRDAMTIFEVEREEVLHRHRDLHRHLFGHNDHLRRSAELSLKFDEILAILQRNNTHGPRGDDDRSAIIHGNDALSPIVYRSPLSDSASPFNAVVNDGERGDSRTPIRNFASFQRPASNADRHYHDNKENRRQPPHTDRVPFVEPAAATEIYKLRRGLKQF
eukprot:PhM_4_TR7237/c0_g1_i1/m.99536